MIGGVLMAAAVETILGVNGVAPCAVAERWGDWCEVTLTAVVVGTKLVTRLGVRGVARVVGCWVEFWDWGEVALRTVVVEAKLVTGLGVRGVACVVVEF
jgi:hypothetical protein